MAESNHLALRSQVRTFLSETALYRDEHPDPAEKRPLESETTKKTLITARGTRTISSTYGGDFPRKIPHTPCRKTIKFSRWWADIGVTSPQTRCLCPPPQKLMSH